MKPGDQITLLFGRPIRIERDGIEIWRDEDIPQYVLSAIIDEQGEGYDDHSLK